MKGKFPFPLDQKTWGIIKIEIDIPESQKLYLRDKYGKEELENLINQKFQEVVDLLALEDQP